MFTKCVTALQQAACPCSTARDRRIRTTRTPREAPRKSSGERRPRAPTTPGAANPPLTVPPGRPGPPTNDAETFALSTPRDNRRPDGLGWDDSACDTVRRLGALRCMKPPRIESVMTRHGSTPSWNGSWNAAPHHLRVAMTRSDRSCPTKRSASGCARTSTKPFATAWSKRRAARRASFECASRQQSTSSRACSMVFRSRPTMRIATV